MQSTHISPVPRALAPRDYAGARLNWLLAANERELVRRRLFRTPVEEEQMLLMARPVSTERAVASFGMMLGTIPPAVIFVKLIAERVFFPYAWVDVLVLMMIAVCCLMGGFMGTKVSSMVARIERDAWNRMLVEAVLVGAVWGAVTGTVGGFLFFGLGAFFGALCGAAVGIPAFLLFIAFHRVLARGGMIETSHFLPLACGITLAIAALILGA
jgi:hypothetical protein